MKNLLHLTDLVYVAVLWLLVSFWGPRNGIWLFGLVFSLVALAFWLLARYQLGCSFSIRAKARKLVTDGLFKWFSHPIYLFGALCHLGILIAFQQWWIIPIWFGVPAPFQRARIKRDDRILEKEFGQDFRDLRKGNLF